MERITLVGRMYRTKGLGHQLFIVTAFVMTLMAGAVAVSMDTLPEKKKKALRTVRALRSTARRSKMEILDIWNN